MLDFLIGQQSQKIPLGYNTVEEHIDEISYDIESYLCHYLHITHSYIQLDESTLLSNEAFVYWHIFVLLWIKKSMKNCFS